MTVRCGTLREGVPSPLRVGTGIAWQGNHTLISMMVVVVGHCWIMGMGRLSGLDPTPNPRDTSKGCVSLKVYLKFL